VSLSQTTNSVQTGIKLFYVEIIKGEFILAWKHTCIDIRILLFFFLAVLGLNHSLIGFHSLPIDEKNQGFCIC
jgi:hypothetical protein